MIFDEDFINKLPDDPASAGNIILNAFEDLYDNYVTLEDRVADYEDYLHSLALLKAFNESQGFNITVPKLTNEKTKNIVFIYNYFSSTRTLIEQYFTDTVSEKFKRIISAKFETGFIYSFSKGDLDKIQSLINELRDLIGKSTLFDDNHRDRLLKRLERLQSELHKKMSDLDRFWGFIGDAGVVLGKFGKDVEPIVNRIEQILKIVWRTQSIAEELPSDIPLPSLPHTVDETKKDK